MWFVTRMKTCQSTSLPLSLSIILYSIYIHIYESKCCTSYWYSRSKYQYTSTINQRYIYTHSSIPPWYSYEQFPAHLQVVLWNPDTLEQHRKLQCAGAVTCVILSNDGGLTLNQKMRIHPWRLTAGTWEYGPPPGKGKSSSQSHHFQIPAVKSSEWRTSQSHVDSYLRDS